jgi:hypothetical protein
MSHLTERERRQISELRGSIESLAFPVERARRRLEEATEEDRAGHRTAAVGKISDAVALLLRVARQAQELADEAEALETQVLRGGTD